MASSALFSIELVVFCSGDYLLEQRDTHPKPISSSALNQWSEGMPTIPNIRKQGRKHTHGV